MTQRRPLRIAVDAAGARSGGGTIRVRELALTLPVLRPHHRYLFVVRRELEAVVRNIAPDIETVCPPGAFDRPPARLAWEQLRLPGFLRDWQPDVVFSPFGVLPLRWGEPRPVLAMIVSNLAPYSPELLRLYRGSGRVRLDILRKLTDRSVAIADSVFLLSSQGFDLIDHPELPAKAEVIPMAPPSVMSIEPTTSAPEEPYFVLVADILRYKGIEAVVAALALLEKSGRPLVLVCGRLLDRPYLRRLVRKSEDLAVAERLRFIGPTDHRMVLSLLSTSAGCIVPSRFENKTRVPYEAMAVGAPLLLNDLQTFRESAGDAGLYFQVDRPEQLAQHMGTLLESEGTRRCLSAAGRARVASIKTTDASEHILGSLERQIEERWASRRAGAAERTRPPASPGRVNILVHAAAGRSGAGRTMIEELACGFPTLRPENDYLFVLSPSMRRMVEKLSPTLRTLSPPFVLSRPPWRLAWEHLALARKRLPWPPDVVFTPFNILPTRWRLPEPRLAVLVLNLAPYSAELRRMYHGIHRLRLELLRWLTTRSLKAADRVFIVSSQALALIDLPGLEAKARLIPVSPVAGEVRDQLPGRTPSEPYFLVAGDLHRYKGVELVVDAVAEFEPSSRPLVLVCGRALDRAYTRSLSRRIRRTGVEDRVRLQGPVERGRLMGLMRDSVALIAPSRFENKSYVPIEAMIEGAPVISSDIPPARESCGRAARYFSLEEPRELAAHMRALLLDPGLRNEMRFEGHRRVSAMRPTDAAESILTTLEELADMNRSMAR